jgi:hypothetical protein
VSTHLQEPTTGSYPEPLETIPHHHNRVFKIQFNIPLPPTFSLQSDIPPSGFPTKIVYDLYMYVHENNFLKSCPYLWLPGYWDMTFIMTDEVIYL